MRSSARVGRQRRRRRRTVERISRSTSSPRAGGGEEALRRGVFPSVPDLIAAIESYLDAHNDDPTPLVWTATAESILAKVQRARATLDAITSQ